MSGFKDMVASDNLGVFLNNDEHAEKRTVIYDGETYDGVDGQGIPVLLTKLKEKDRRQLVTDHAQGLYLVTTVLHCTLSDIGGTLPEKGQRIKINEEEGGGFFYEYRIAASGCAMGMVRAELEAIDE